MASFQVPICALALIVLIQISSRSVYCTGSDDNFGSVSTLPHYQKCQYYICQPCGNHIGCGHGDYCNGHYGCSGYGSDKYCGCSGYGCSNGYGDYCFDGCNPNVCFIVLDCGNGYSCYGEHTKSHKRDVDGSY